MQIEEETYIIDLLHTEFQETDCLDTDIHTQILRHGYRDVYIYTWIFRK